MIKKLVALVLAGFVVQGAELKVLSVGNSFSANAHRYLRQITEAQGDTIVLTNAYIGGCDFERHMRHVKANESPYGGKSLKDLLTARKWDIVTIQQASPKSFKFETFHPYVDELIAYIRQYAPQAEIVIHETWAYRPDHLFWGLKDFNDEKMYAGVKDAYGRLAKETGFRMIRGGDAMYLAKHSPEWGPFVPDPTFDRKTSKELPVGEKRSLHCGFSKDKTGKLRFDGFHANTSGEYLLGCVWYEFLFKKSCEGNTFRPKGVSDEDAAALQKVAAKVRAW